MRDSAGQPEEGAPLPVGAEVVAPPVSVVMAVAPAAGLSHAPLLEPPPLPSPHLDVMSPRERRDALFELAVAMSVGVLPNLLGAVASQAGWRREAQSSEWSAIVGSYVVHNMTVALPVLWIMYRSGLGRSYYGLAPVRPLRDAGWGLVVLVCTLVMFYGVAIAFWVGSWASPVLGQALTVVPAAAGQAATADARGAPWWLFLASMTMTTTVEELFTRAYLMPALARLWRSPWPAAFAASAIMASYHVYQGSYAVVMIFVVEAALNGVFWRYRRIWPFMVGHALYDAVLFLPYMRGEA